MITILQNSISLALMSEPIYDLIRKTFLSTLLPENFHPGEIFGIFTSHAFSRTLHRPSFLNSCGVLDGRPETVLFEWTRI